MSNEARVSELLVQTGAFKDLDVPVILTSGELGIYYINTEKLCQDGGDFEKFGDNSEEMINHAVKMTKEHPTFGEVIDKLAEKVQKLAYEASIQPKTTEVFISGGQRRDWIFSGPVANRLGLQHISIYKDGKIEVINTSGLKEDGCAKASLIYHNPLAIHIADLLTEASSCYRLENEIPRGWVPELRGNHVAIRDLVSVVSRLQGGERNLAHQGVFTDSLVTIGDDFLRGHSADPDRALEYNADPRAWSEGYLRDNGALTLLPTFDPAGKKLDRAKKFMKRYGDVLEQARKMGELDDACRDKYGKSAEELVA